MILPTDDSLVLPEDDDGSLTVDTSVLAWDGTPEDLLNLLPSFFRKGQILDRDAILFMLGELANFVWSRGSFILASEQSPRYADDEWLDYWGGLLGRKRVPQETNAAYRERLLSGIKTITPEAIEAAVIAVVSLFTSKKTYFLEPAVDAAYCQPATTTDDVVRNSNNDPTSTTYMPGQQAVVPEWAAFTQPVAGGNTPNQTVYFNQTKRLLSYYPDSLINPAPPSYSVPLTTGGEFWIIPPADSGADNQTPHAQPLTDSITTGQFNNDFDFAAPATTSDAVVPNSNNDPTVKRFTYLIGTRDFSITELVTDGTSGATGRVVDSYAQILTVNEVVGVFGNGHALTGSLGGNGTETSPPFSTYDTQSAHGVVPVWAWGYGVPPGSSLGERIISEVEPRIAAGTNWRIFFDPFIAGAI